MRNFAEPRKAVVVNSGTHPDPMHIANSLAAAGVLEAYYTSSSWAEDSLTQRLSSSRWLAKLAMARNLRKRTLPSHIQTRMVKRRGVFHELRFQVGMRIAKQSRGHLLFAGLRAFEQKVAKETARWHNVDTVFAQYMAAELVFAALPDHMTAVLNYPIAHHRWTDRAYAKEALRNPDWAPFLHSFGNPPWMSDKLDREIEQADIVLVPSLFVARTFEDEGVSRKKIVVAPLASNLPPTEVDGPPRSYAAEFSAERPMRLLFAGQLTQRKGLSYLLQAVKQRRDVELTLVGSAMPGIESLILASGVINPTILSPVPRAELSALMMKSDFLVLPSLAEGFPLVAIEAMSCGTPCILSENTFVSDLIEDGINGLVVEAGSADSLSKAIDRILNDPSSSSRMGIAAKKTALMYTWERFEQQISALYTSLSKSSRDSSDNAEVSGR